MSSVYPKGKVLWFRLKVDGKWTGVPTEFKVGQERAAQAMLDRYESRRAAGVEVVGDLGPVTVARFNASWIKVREAEVQTWANDESVMRLHVLPVIGQMRLDEVRPLHLVKLVSGWRARKGAERMAPRTIYNAWSTVCAFFRDACIEDLLPSSPCILTKRQLGPKIDGDPEWRPTALFTRAELEQLISDERVPMDRRVLYALEGIAGLRHGEAAGLLWRNVNAQPETPPLGMLYVAFSYERPLPKGDVCRPVPIHPALAAILAEWKLAGWAEMMKRAPSPDDLVVPLPPDGVSKFGRWRDKGYSHKRLKGDLEKLGLRHRRGHDLRRTCISLSRSDGAMSDILRRATHRPAKEVIDGYTTFEWAVVCREVMKLKIQRHQTGTVIAIPKASAGNDARFAPVFAPDNHNHLEHFRKTEGGTRIRTGLGGDEEGTTSIDYQENSTGCAHCGGANVVRNSEQGTNSGSKGANLGARARVLLEKYAGAAR